MRNFFREGLGSFARRTQRTKKFDPFVLDGLDADSPWYIASYIHVSHRLIVYESNIMKETHYTYDKKGKSPKICCYKQIFTV